MRKKVKKKRCLFVIDKNIQKINKIIVLIKNHTQKKNKDEGY